MVSLTRQVLERSFLLLLASAALGCGEGKRVASIEGGRPERGKLAILNYGCTACHAIPGVPGHGASVGPPLSHMAQQAYVAGVLPNTPDNLVRWLQDPPRVDPRTVMPNLGLSEAQATDIAAYLYSVD